MIEPSSFLRGATTIGERCTVGPLTTLIDARSATRSECRTPTSTSARSRAGASVGPFAYLRPGALLRERAKAGTFVEIKNSDIGEGTKVPHLSYIGDADVGARHEPRRRARSPPTTTAASKHRTTIGADVRTSVDTTLVAPVTIGDDAYTSPRAPSITEDVPARRARRSRARARRNIEGYAERKQEARGARTPAVVTHARTTESMS